LPASTSATRPARANRAGDYRCSQRLPGLGGESRFRARGDLLARALAARNGFVLKPSELTPITVEEIEVAKVLKVDRPADDAPVMRARLDDSPIRRDRGASARHFARASLYIVDHLRDSTLSVERIAHATGVSPGHLHEVFRRTTGGTIGDYIRAQRLERCRRDLADQSLRHQSITFIAHRWGFTEASSLSRAFRAAYQTSPRRYRQEKQTDGVVDHLPGGAGIAKIDGRLP
jgi:AraC-like DNA-binding protein